MLEGKPDILQDWREKFLNTYKVRGGGASGPSVGYLSVTLNSTFYNNCTSFYAKARWTSPQATWHMPNFSSYLSLCNLLSCLLKYKMTKQSKEFEAFYDDII